MEVTIEKLDHFGRGICHIDGQLCFVENAFPDEVVKIEITKQHKKYLEATVSEIKKASVCRTTSHCPYSDTCGGCQFDTYLYDAENKYKEEKIKEIMERYGHISSDKVLPILYGEDLFYRNKIVLHGENGLLGLYKTNSNTIVPIQECSLVHPKINHMISILQSKSKSISEATIKCSNDGEEVLVSITGDVTDTSSLLEICDVLILNNQYLTEKKDIINRIGEYSFHESTSSFFQVHSTMTKVLYDQVLNAVKEIQPKQVLDLYCGTGTIGIYVSPYCEHITGVDSNPSNIEDAKKNLLLNDIHSIDYICDKVENVIDQFHAIDCVIVDPPRNGLDEKSRGVLKELGSQHILYVSCDPITLARDLDDLKDVYDVISVQPVNMFPKTYHVETVSVLCRKTIE